MKSSYYAGLPSSQYIARKSRRVWLQSHASSIDPSRRTWKFVCGRLSRKGAEVDSFVLTFFSLGLLQLNNVLKQQNWKYVPNIPVPGWERGHMLVPWRPRPHGQAWLTITSFTREQRIMMRWPTSYPCLRNLQRSIPSRWCLCPTPETTRVK